MPATPRTCVLMIALLQLWAPRPLDAANVLAVQSVPGKSHWNVMRAVLRALTDRGHNVTAFTPFPDGDRENYVEADLSDHPLLRPTYSLDVVYLAQSYGPVAGVTTLMANATRAFCAAIYADHRMDEILRQGSAAARFDVVITEPFASECVAYVATVLGAPLVYVVPPPMPTYLERELFGHAPNPAVVPHVMSAGGALRTFGQRLTNVVLTVYCSAINWRAERRLRRDDPHQFDRPDLVKPSITFVNTHFVTEPSRSFTPNVVQIGGIHLAPPKPLPPDVLEFIENSPHGVIYFTFGSVVSMSSFPETVQKAFVEALGRVPQRVLWKYEGEMKDKPKNVMTRKWFPQRDILMHPNVKLFICHGGISGVYEAVDAGVPVLGFPIFFDQPRNIGNLVEAGMAISMDLFEVSADKVFSAVSKLVNDEKYRKNAETVSKLFWDRPMSPSESVAYWTEYVVRHGGASHLRSHGIDLHWYQYYLIDVTAALAILASVVLLFTGVCLKMAYKCVLKCFQKFKTKPKRE